MIPSFSTPAQQWTGKLLGVYDGTPVPPNSAYTRLIEAIITNGNTDLEAIAAIPSEIVKLVYKMFVDSSYIVEKPHSRLGRLLWWGLYADNFTLLEYREGLSIAVTDGIRTWYYIIDDDLECIWAKYVAEQFDVDGGPYYITTENNIYCTSAGERYKLAPASTTIDDYMYTRTYHGLDYDDALNYFNTNSGYSLGLCTSISVGPFLARNYDWTYDETAYFHVVNKRGLNTKYESRAICGGFSALTKEFVESEQSSDLYKYVPFLCLNGINEKGVAVTVNVVPNDAGPTTGTTPSGTLELTIPTTMVNRYVLDNFDSAQAAVEYLQEHVSVYTPSSGGFQSEVHFMIRDSQKTYLIEFILNDMVVTEMSQITWMTNFLLESVSYDSNNHVLPDTVTDYGMGLERFDIVSDGIDTVTDVTSLMELMKDLYYTNAYKPDAVWKTEFTSEESGRKVTDPLEDFESVINTAREMYTRRTRDGSLWQTCHTSIYNVVSGEEYLLVQEGTTVYEF